MGVAVLDSTKRRSYYHLPNPQFFKPLIPGFQTNFVIPEAFEKYLVEDYAKEHDKMAVLRDRKRKEKTWEVKVVVDNNGRHHFKDGWEKYCKDHDLRVGDFLVFRHHAHLVFDVTIFDPPTACERDYPDFDDCELAKKISLSSINALNNGWEKMMGDENGNSKGEATYKPSGRPYFRTLIKSYNLACGKLYIPRGFAEQNGLNKRWCEMVVIDERDESWPMLLRHNKSIGDNPYIGRWRGFHRAKGLNNGDLIVFELVHSRKKPVMRFYRGKRTTDENRSKEGVFLQATTYPCCRMVVKPYHWNKGMHFPCDFARKNGLTKRRGEMEIKDEKGRSWSLPLRNYHHGKGAYIVGSSWRHFQEANGLNVGDSFVFELISCGEKPIMKLYTHV